jgi:threonine/homoserine/homoserine lactone efflux protein
LKGQSHERRLSNHLLFFIAAGLLLNLTPGPDVLYIVTHALRSGARAGMVAAWASRPAALCTSSPRPWV